MFVAYGIETEVFHHYLWDFLVKIVFDVRSLVCRFDQSFPLDLFCLLIKFWWQGSFLSSTSFWFKSHFLFCCKLFILICCMQLPTRILRQIPGRMIRLIQQWVSCFDVGLIFLIIFVTDPLHCGGRYLLVVWRRMSLMTFWDKCLASLVNWFMWKFRQANVVDLFNLLIGKEADDFPDMFWQLFSLFNYVNAKRLFFPQKLIYCVISVAWIWFVELALSKLCQSWMVLR